MHLHLNICKCVYMYVRLCMYVSMDECIIILMKLFKVPHKGAGYIN